MKFFKDMTLIELMIIAAIVGILAAVVLGLPAQKKERDDFMASCAAREPQYECEVKWKQMHPDPVVIYAPMNR